jgi:23S rRNA A2030 N6-methylase RlmJ
MMQSIFSWHGTKGYINYYYQFPCVDVIVINSFSLKLLENMVKNYMLSEISVKVFRSGRKLVGPGMFYIKDFIKICDFEPQSSIV